MSTKNTHPLAARALALLEEIGERIGELDALEVPYSSTADDLLAFRSAFGLTLPGNGSESDEVARNLTSQLARRLETAIIRLARQLDGCEKRLTNHARQGTCPTLWCDESFPLESLVMRSHARLTGMWRVVQVGMLAEDHPLRAIEPIEPGRRHEVALGPVGSWYSLASAEHSSRLWRDVLAEDRRRSAAEVEARRQQEQREADYARREQMDHRDVAIEQLQQQVAALVAERKVGAR